MVHFHYPETHDRPPIKHNPYLESNFPRNIFRTTYLRCSGTPARHFKLDGTNLYTGDLQRYQIRGDETLTGPKSIIERFFIWDAGIQTTNDDPPTYDLSTNIIELVSHGHKSSARSLSPKQEPECQHPYIFWRRRRRMGLWRLGMLRGVAGRVGWS